MAVSIRASFQNQPLPNYQIPAGISTASASGDSTINTDPPKFATSYPLANWTNLSTQFLAATPQGIIDNEFLYERENAMYHANEGDVVRAAGLYLLHPVNQALCEPNQLRDTIKCQSEFTSNRIRSDITYYRNPQGPNLPPRAFAVVEFKNRGVIRQAEFRAAQKNITQNTPAQVHITGAYNQPSGTNSYFVGNSLMLIKQAGAYAIRHQTQYVALFDWDCLLLVRFTQMNPGSSLQNLLNNGVGDWCSTTIIPYAQSASMRPALLGFLYEAHQNTP